MKANKTYALFALFILTGLAKAENIGSQFECNPKADPQRIFDLIAEERKVNHVKVALVKYNCMTGEAWSKSEKGWSFIKDLKPLPKSIYYIKRIESGSGTTSLLRIDRANGKTWFVKNDTWTEL